MHTEIKENNVDIEQYEDINEDEYEKYVLDLSLPLKTRFKLLHRFYDFYYDNTVEVISRMASMYQFSGTKLLEEYLTHIALYSKLSSFLKVEAVKGLFSFEEYEEEISDKYDDDEMKEIKTLSNKSIKERNNKRRQNAFFCLNEVCKSFDSSLSITYQIEVISMLMENSDYDEQSSSYFLKIIENTSLTSEFRYKTILSLERTKITNRQYHLSKSLLTFINNENNDTNYIILSAQYILQHLKTEETEKVENILYFIATNEENEYNTRADATDVLLSLGSTEMKEKGREIIKELAGKGITIYDNKQNVHIKSIETSVQEILNKLQPYTSNTDDIDKIYSYIKELCEKQNISDENIKLIDVSLTRIKIDRVLYSSASLTLSAILIRVYNYMLSHKCKEEMEKRLIEELIEMSGTCSSGYVSRLVNCVSGFGEMIITISFEEQVVSNLSGRLNASLNKIFEKESLMRKNINQIKKLIITNGTDEFILEEFWEKVVEEMSNKEYNNKPHFLLFFRTYISSIREEMFKEFIEYISEGEFDLYFRKALSYYDGIRDFI